MDLKSIKTIIDHSLFSTEQKELAILSILSQDPKVIPYLLAMIQSERESTKTLIQELNVLVSLSQAALTNPKTLSAWGRKYYGFLAGRIQTFYEDFTDSIKNCFKQI